MAKQKNKLTITAAALLFFAGLGWLIYSGLESGSVYFLNVSEAHAVSPEALKSARLFGTVAADSIQKFTDSPGVKFTLEDKDNPSLTLNVSYHGVVPDTFKVGAEVIVEGGMDSNCFAAKTLMTKCPSKYQKENRKS